MFAHIFLSFSFTQSLDDQFCHQEFGHGSPWPNKSTNGMLFVSRKRRASLPWMLLRGRNSRTANSTKSSPWCENSQRQPNRLVNNSAWTRWRAFCDRVTVVGLHPFLLLVCCCKGVTCGGPLFIAGSCFESETAVQTNFSGESAFHESVGVGIFDTFYLLLERVCWRKWLFVETAAVDFFLLLLGIGGMTDSLAHFSGQLFVTAYTIRSSGTNCFYIYS